MDEARINKVIEILSKSDQTLVFLDSIICPVRDYMGDSPRENEMHELVDILKKREIIEYAMGFWSNMETPGYVFIDTFTLTDKFFKSTREKEYKQLKLF
jgi:hypothetical protein